MSEKSDLQDLALGSWQSSLSNAMKGYMDQGDLVSGILLRGAQGHDRGQYKSHHQLVFLHLCRLDIDAVSSSVAHAWDTVHGRLNCPGHATIPDTSVVAPGMRVMCPMKKEAGN